MTTPSIQEPGNQGVGASALPTGLSSAAPIEPASPSRPEASIPSRDDIQAVYDCIILSCQHTGYHARGATALRTINALCDHRDELIENLEYATKLLSAWPILNATAQVQHLVSVVERARVAA